MPGFKSPYPLREGQADLIQYFEEALSSGGVCLAHAPTGIGKTLAALLAALPNLPEDGKILYAVNRKNQIPIILKELRMINAQNGTSFRAAAFASKADLCRDGDLKKLGYRELLEACELRRKSWACPYHRALYENPEDPGSTARPESARRRKSQAATEFERKILDEMPPPHLLERMAKRVEEDAGSPPICLYEVLKWAAKSSEVVVGTFWYSFHPLVSQSILRSLSVSMGKCILICDEAHNLPKFCRESLSHGISQTRIDYAIEETRRYSEEFEKIGISGKGIEDLLLAFSGLFERFEFTSEGKHLPFGLARAFMARAGIRSLEGPIESLEAAGEAVLESKIAEGQQPTSNLATAGSFIRPFLLCNDHAFERFCVLSRTPKGRSVRRLEIRCLDPASLSSSVLDPGQPTAAKGAVLMSGTLVPGGYYRDILGIPFAPHREFPNIFPAANRALFLDDTISLAWKARSESMYRAILEKLLAVKAHTPGGCMFFFPSYEVMKEILALYPSDDLFVERRASTKREEVESALKSSRSVLAVMGASLGEGVDLPGLVRAIAVFGLPLDRISDMVKLGMEYYNAKFPGKGRDYFYYLPAVTKIVQSAGRAHRSSEDKAALYVFDRRFCRYYLGSAPSWWRDEGVRLKGTEDLIARTQEFWAPSSAGTGI